ncbi:aminodeoxyfutalosine synthase [Neorhodopirellula lusitana]|uniref:Aminodeoxyfutalosine synthase n=1 Tax=Neorhodopirellula lusitana TaxID=445327 RepID=A0ABY1PUE5_9BACT|nr:aminofutalosine synthase MqnE [Neorhodopirellula lusitana]SMP44292.1 aminodeoxyfutalosine synthase [Neorhodopirellula lusitana]
MIAAERDARFREIRDKVEAEERLSLDDGIFLYDPSVSLQAVGELANFVRERLNGNVGYYNINTHLNPTNVCVYRCRFCAFRKDLRDEKGYAMTDEQILERGREATANGCTEMHIVGGLHHQRKYEWYRGIISLLKENFPQIHLKAWTAVEIDWFRFQTKKDFRWVLEDMREAGQGSMPGGGAEIFHPEVRDQLCEHKANTPSWIEIHKTAHQIGMKTNCTMLYGHVEKAYHRIDHLMRLRELQDKTNGFQVFIPLAFHPENTGLSDLKKPSGLMDLRTVAVSRLMLDNIRHIKAYWIMLGIETAQTALAYGADDIDGTVRHELIYHDAGAKTPEFLSVEQIQHLIREAGREPAERDTQYNHIIRDENDFTKWRTGESVDAISPSAAIVS